MKKDEFHDLVLSELRDMKNDIKEVRQIDIPNLNTAVGGFRTEIENLKKSSTWSTRLYTILGGALAVTISKFTGGHH